MFQTYNNFESHEHGFNTIFATGTTVVISLLIGGWLASINFFNSSNTWFIFLILIAAPIVVFIATSGNSEFRTAYYKTWRDKLIGRLDQRKILKQFAKQYRIKDWKTKLENIEADGRWNFHPETNYMHNLTEQRDLLLSRIHQEYSDKLTEQNKLIIEEKRVVANAGVQVDLAKKAEIISKERLDSAKSSGEIYKQRHDYNSSVRKVSECEEAKNNALHQLREAEQDRENLHENYRDVVYRVIKIYYVRYTKYTESAIKKINRINGLKYEIADMPEAESWINNPARKEL